MRMLAFASRNVKELLRDKLNLAFGLGFPLVLLGLLSAIQASIPIELFAIERLAPGVAVFGYSFFSLFAGMLIARDRTSSFMLRLFTSPLTAVDFILGYTLPMLPLALLQSIVCYAVAVALGLPVTIHLLWALLAGIPAAVLYIAIGLLCGSLLTDKQVGGVCGALLTNLSAWLSGTWFDLNLVGGAFSAIAHALPFAHAVSAGRAALAGAAVFPDLWWVLGYAVLLLGVAIAAFTRKMRGV